MKVIKSEQSSKYPRFKLVGNEILAVGVLPPPTKGAEWFGRFKKAGSLLVTDTRPLAQKSVKTYAFVLRQMGWATREGDSLVFTGPASASWAEVRAKIKALAQNLTK